MPSCVGHKAGNILKIKLKNFMTYDKLELITGPGLNMIIGPNGSGKSSIICAICLGLGGKPFTTGRQLKLSEYIKHGAKCATIQIVLADLAAESGTLKIERRLSQSGPSEYRLNNVIVKETVVEKEIGRFNIQVNNLCQFLPQEKVAEFSKMTPKMLLESMQQTVDKDHTLHKTYKELIKDRSTVLQYENDMNEVRGSLEKFKQRNDHLLPGLKKFQNVLELKEKIKKLEEKREVLVYQDLLRKAKEAAEAVENSKNLLVTFKENNVSTLDRQCQIVIGEIQTYTNQMKSLNSDATKSKNSISEHLDNTKKIDNMMYEAKEFLRNKYEDFKKAGEKKDEIRKQIAAFESNVQKYLDLKERLTQEATAREAQRHANNLNMTNAEQDIADKQDDINRCAYEEKNLQTKLRTLNDLENRKREVLKRQDKDTFNAYNWLQENRHLFNKEIIGPLVLLVNVPDVQNAKFLETHIAQRDMTLFLCEDTEDTKKFTNILRAQLKLCVNAACISTTKPLHTYRSSRPDCLNKYRFTAFLKDLFEAPDNVKSYLCERYNIHNTPVGNDATEAYISNRGNSIIQEMPFQRFYTSTTSYMIRRSKYGNNLASVNTNQIRDRGYLSSFASSSQEERMQLQSEIAALNQDRLRFEAEKESLLQVKKEIFDLVEKDRQKQEELNNTNKSLKSYKQQIELKNRALAKLDEDSRSTDIKALQEECSEKLSDYKNQKIASLREVLECCKEWFELTKKKCSLHIYKASSLEKKQNIETDMELNKSELTELESSYEEKKQEMLKIKSASRNQRDKASQKVGFDLRSEDRKKQLKERYKSLPATPDGIDAEKRSLETRMALMGDNTSATIVDEHKELEQRIKTEQRHLDKMTADLEKINADITRKKERWLIPLQELIGKISVRFSSYFESMGCAGEICLKKDDNENDFDKYGLSIQVKYRDTVPLRELSQAHHSGGECSVATIIFILSLQELVEVPFRCVDEINQGMDAINERKIFEFVAESAQNSSQYFLLTPKLLHGLPYPKKANLHVIYNGPCLEFTDWKESTLIGEDDDEGE